MCSDLLHVSRCVGEVLLCCGVALHELFGLGHDHRGDVGRDCDFCILEDRGEFRDSSIEVWGVHRCIQVKFVDLELVCYCVDGLNDLTHGLNHLLILGSLGEVELGELGFFLGD